MFKESQINNFEIYILQSVAYFLIYQISIPKSTINSFVDLLTCIKLTYMVKQTQINNIEINILKSVAYF